MEDNPKIIETNDKYVLDEQGNPVPERDLLKWAAWMEDDKHRRLLKTDLGPLGWVSTIFLGMDHDFLSMLREEQPELSDEQPHWPILWETVVFGGPYDDEQRRYRSKEDAIEGHAELVAMCKLAGKKGRIFYWWFVEWLKYGEIWFLFLKREAQKGIKRLQNSKG
jgi:hypothetical protein